MNRELIVTLLRKDIQELDMITEGFMEINEYPKAIIQLAQRKSNDIQSYIQQLAEIKPIEVVSKHETDFETSSPDSEIVTETITENIVYDNVVELDLKEDDTENASQIIEIIELQDNDRSEITVLETEEVTEVVSTTTTETTKTTTTEDTKKIILAEKISSYPLTRNETLSKPEHSISSTIANKKIEDIKQALSIGDRFRFQRELFHGNGEEMNKTLTYINQLATFDEVQSFLQSKYNWDVENESVEDFYQIVKRRF